jgi:hypothetical protein
MLGSARGLERRLKNKKGQEGQEGAKRPERFLPLLALLCPKPVFFSQPLKENE